MHLTGLRVDNGQGLPRIVDKELFTGPVTLAHDHVEFSGPGAIGLTKPAILEAIGGLCLVFLPQQRQGDAFALEFLVHHGPVGGQMDQGAFGRRRREQARLQGRFIESLGERPRQAGGLGALDVVGHGGPAQAEALSNLALTKSRSPFES